MNNSIIIRPYQPTDIAALINLFRDAVHTINIQHYSPEQVAAWTNIDPDRWHQTLATNITLVAEHEGRIVGFADITHEGYLDRLYIDKDYQGRRVSLLLLRAIENAARELGLTKITTDCSITAKKPAEFMGFVVISEQVVEKRGQKFINYAMEKVLK